MYESGFPRPCCLHKESSIAFSADHLGSVPTESSEIVSQPGYELEIILQLSRRRDVFIGVLHDQAHAQGFADGSGYAGFGAHEVIPEILNFRNVLDALPDLRSGAELVFAPFAEAQSDI